MDQVTAKACDIYGDLKQGTTEYFKMPQKIRVLQCFQCHLFQVDIVKKSTKWQCRVCNSKQTVRKEYFRGNGAECRAKVQELNRATGEKNNELFHSFLDISAELHESTCSATNTLDDDQVYDVEKCSGTEKYCPLSKTTEKSVSIVSKENVIGSKKSKWGDYA